MPPIPAGMCSMLASAPQWPNFKLVMVLDLRNFQVFFEIHDDMLQAALLVLRIVQGLAQVPALITWRLQLGPQIWHLEEGGDKTNTGLDFVLTVKVTILSALRTWSEVTCSGLSPEDLNEGVPSEWYTHHFWVWILFYFKLMHTAKSRYTHACVASMKTQIVCLPACLPACLSLFLSLFLSLIRSPSLSTNVTEWCMACVHLVLWTRYVCVEILMYKVSFIHACMYIIINNAVIWYLLISC